MNGPTTPISTTAGLAAARLRTAEAWELVVFDRLNAEEQAAFDELRRDPAFYGILRPRGAGAQTWKAVTQDTALLLLTLREPAPLPSFAAREPDAAEAVSRLVLDGVLEIEHQGRFVAGAAALEVLAGAPSEDPRHPLARLSREALRFAAATEPAELGALSNELYGFHRMPITPAWARRLPDAEAVLGYLGLGDGSPARRAAERSWDFGDRDDAPGWIYFRRRAHTERGQPRSDGGFKLYVSPAIDDLPRAFAATLAAAARCGVGQLKIGCDAAGLLRPDKLVLYFAGLDALLAAARDLETGLAGVRAHGVPFTAPIDPAGLLSWGSDPPAALRPLSWQGRESWRTWLAGRMASALLAAGTPDPEVASRFALERLRREGVDVERWAPTTTLFRAA